MLPLNRWFVQNAQFPGPRLERKRQQQEAVLAENTGQQGTGGARAVVQRLSGSEERVATLSNNVRPRFVANDVSWLRCGDSSGSGAR